jgi:hypothetical protein
VSCCSFCWYAVHRTILPLPYARLPISNITCTARLLALCSLLSSCQELNSSSFCPSPVQQPSGGRAASLFHCCYQRDDRWHAQNSIERPRVLHNTRSAVHSLSSLLGRASTQKHIHTCTRSQSTPH